MDRRHQVFISSTYGDLKDERAEIIQALLELDCIPAGMELFPAATSEAWDLIKGVIDDSDYYCLVIAGRYGSVDASGISFTEKEYDYALSQKKPVMAFFHADPESLAASRTEKTDLGKKQLEEFRKKVEQAHHRRQWSTPAELGGLVSRGLVNMRKTNPSEGWIRGRFAATEGHLVELAELRARVAELTATASKPSNATIKDIATLAQGSDEHSVLVHYLETGKKLREKKNILVTWDEILRYVGPALVNECTEGEFLEKLRLCMYHAIEKTLKITITYSSIVIPTVVIDRIKTQLQALGQIAPGLRRRAVSDNTTYWRLTDLGSKRLINAQAIMKPKPKISTPERTVKNPPATTK
jgi:hypothetical protein